MARETSGQPEACAHDPEVSSCHFVLIIRVPDIIFEAGRSVHFRDCRRNVLPPPCLRAGCTGLSHISDRSTLFLSPDIFSGQIIGRAQGATAMGGPSPVR